MHLSERTGPARRPDDRLIEVERVSVPKFKILPFSQDFRHCFARDISFTIMGSGVRHICTYKAYQVNLKLTRQLSPRQQNLLC